MALYRTDKTANLVSCQISQQLLNETFQQKNLTFNLNRKVSLSTDLRPLNETFQKSPLNEAVW